MKKLLILSAFIATGVLFNDSFAASLIVPSAVSVKDPDPAKVKAAVGSFKNLSHHERKMMMKDVKATIRDYKKEKKEGKDPSTNTLLMVIIAILLPPLAV